MCGDLLGLSAEQLGRDDFFVYEDVTAGQAGVLQAFHTGLIIDAGAL